MARGLGSDPHLATKLTLGHDKGCGEMHFRSHKEVNLPNLHLVKNNMQTETQPLFKIRSSLNIAMQFASQGISAKKHRSGGKVGVQMHILEKIGLKCLLLVKIALQK